MAELNFIGFDEIVDKLERIGKFDDKNIKRIADAGAKVAFQAYKALAKFGKYAKKKLLSDKKGYWVGYEGQTRSGTRAFTAAYVYEYGRKGNGKRAYHKGAVTPQISRPWVADMTAMYEPLMQQAMEKEFEKILDEV